MDPLEELSKLDADEIAALHELLGGYDSLLAFELHERMMNGISTRLAYRYPRFFAADFDVEQLEGVIQNDLLYQRRLRWLAIDIGLVEADMRMPDHDRAGREAWLNTDDEDEMERIATLRQTYEKQVADAKRKQNARYARQ